MIAAASLQVVLVNGYSLHSALLLQEDTKEEIIARAEEALLFASLVWSKQFSSAVRSSTLGYQFEDGKSQGELITPQGRINHAIRPLDDTTTTD